MVFFGSNFLYGLSGRKDLVDFSELEKVLKAQFADGKFRVNDKVQGKKVKGKAQVIEGVTEFSFTGGFNEHVKSFFTTQSFEDFDR